MARANYKLASTRVSSGGGSKGLRPSTISGRTGRIGTARIPANAAVMQWTDMPVPKIQEDPLAEGVQTLGQVWAKAAFDYNDRVTDVQAKEAAVALEAKLQGLFYGTDKSPGYASTRGQASQEGPNSYHAYSAKVAAVTKETLENLPKGVAAKATQVAVKLQNEYLNRGASHKAAQYKVWQENVRKAEEDVVMRKVVAESADPLKFGESVSSYMKSIEASYPGQPELVKVKKQEALDKILDTTITYHIGNRNWQMTQQYLDIAEAMNADARVIAKGEKSMQAAVRAANAEARARESFRMQQIDRFEKDQMQRYLSQAVEMDDPTVLANITNIKDRSQAMNIFNNIRSGAESSQEALKDAYTRWDEWVQDPTKIFDPEDPSLKGLSADDRYKISRQAVADRRHGTASLRKDVANWVKSRLPDTSGPMGKYFKGPATKLELRLTDRFNHVIDNAIEEGNDPTEAVYAEMTKVIKEEEDSTVDSVFTIKREALPRIDGVSNGGMFDLDTMLKTINKAPTTDSIDAYEQVVKTQYANTAEQIFKQYYSGNLRVTSLPELFASLSPKDRRELKRKLMQLELQRRYYETYGGVGRPKNLKSVSE